MRKALFYHGLLFLSGTFLVSLTSTLDTDYETQSMTEQEIWDEHNSYRIKYIPVDENFAQKSWDIVEHNENSKTEVNVDLHMVHLAFNFALYDEFADNICISRSGYIFSLLHDFLIVPLFVFNASSIYKYLETDDSFHVNWENVLVKDARDEDEMRFQASLFKNGTVQFVYMKIPQQSALTAYAATNNTFVGVCHDIHIKDSNGSRASYHFGHSMDMNQFKIQNGTVIRFEPLPSCTQYKDCQSCVSATVSKDLKRTHLCVWCPRINTCSRKNGYHQSTWIWSGCDPLEVSDTLTCSSPYKENKAKWANELTAFITFFSIFNAVIVAICYLSTLKQCRPSEIRRRMRPIVTRLRNIYNDAIGADGGQPLVVQYAAADYINEAQC